VCGGGSGGGGGGGGCVGEPVAATSLRECEQRAASSEQRASSCVLFDIDNIDNELMELKASDVGAVGSRYSVSEAIVRQLVILTSAPPP
jgi:hypothetical protein